MMLQIQVEEGNIFKCLHESMMCRKNPELHTRPFAQKSAPTVVIWRKENKWMLKASTTLLTYSPPILYVLRLRTTILLNGYSKGIVFLLKWDGDLRLSTHSFKMGKKFAKIH